MEIVSKIEPKTVEVTDVDVFFSGEMLGLTLGAGDVLTATDEHMRVDYANGEVVVIRKRHVLYTSTRKRIVTLLPEKDAAPHRGN